MADLIDNSQNSLKCGSVSVEFYLKDGRQLNTLQIIKDIRTASENNFETRYTEDESKIGIYPIFYKVYYAEYPEIQEESSEAFVIELKDPCLKSDSFILPSQLLDQTYTITQAAVSY